MTAFRCDHHVAAGRPRNEHRFPETRAGTDERARTGRVARSLVEHDEVRLPDRQDPERQRVEVIRQADRGEAERPREVPLVEDPGKVGRLRAPVLHGTSDAETSVGRKAPALVALVLLADRREARILPAVVAACAREIDTQRRVGLAGRYHLGYGKQRFRAPDVPREHLHDAAHPNRCDFEDQATSAAR